jgi:hypothetical protein
MNYILYINNFKIYTSDDLNNTIHEMLVYLCVFKYCNAKILQIEKIKDKTFPIIHHIIYYYNNNIYIDNEIMQSNKLANYNLKLLNSLNNIFNQNNQDINTFNNDLNNFKLQEEIISNNIEPVVKLVNDNLDNIKIKESNNSQESQENLQEMEKMMKELMEEKKRLENKLKEEKENIIDDEIYINKICQENGEKMLERVYKENNEERKRIFNNDLNCYYQISKDIMNNKIKEENISPLFKHKYNIFQFMEYEKLLNQEKNFDIYMNIYYRLYPSENKEPEYKLSEFNLLDLDDEKCFKCQNFSSDKTLLSFNEIINNLNINEQIKLIEQSGLNINNYLDEINDSDHSDSSDDIDINSD